MAEDELVRQELPRAAGDVPMEAAQAAADSPPAVQAVVPKAPAKKAPARTAPAKKAPAKKTPAKKAPAKKTPAAKRAKTVGRTAAVDAMAVEDAPTQARGPVFGAPYEGWAPASPPQSTVETRTSAATTPAPPRAAGWTKPSWEPDTDKAGRGRGRRVLLVLLVLVAVGALVFFAIRMANRSTSSRDYSTLKVGDCLQTPSGTEVKGVEMQPCAGAHDAEVYAVVDHPAPRGAPYPGVPALVEFAGASCLGQAFTDYVGRPRAESTLKNLEIVPELSAWKEGRRQIVCAVDNSGGPKLTGSVRGTAR